MLTSIHGVGKESTLGFVVTSRNAAPNWLTTMGGTYSSLKYLMFFEDWNYSSTNMGYVVWVSSF